MQDELTRVRQSWRRATPLVLMLLCLLPILAAGILYLSGFSPTNRLNHGDLFDPPRSLQGLPLTGVQGTPTPLSVWKGKWSLVRRVEPPCGEQCRLGLEDMLRIQVGVGKGAMRLQRVVVLTSFDGIADFASSVREHRDLITLIPETDEALRDLLAAFETAAFPPEAIYIVDPRGRLVLGYRPHVTPGDVIHDLKRLLRYSWIG